MSTQQQYKSIIISSENKQIISNCIKNLQDRFRIIGENNPDVIEIHPKDGKSIGIKQSKSLNTWAQLKPFQSLGKLGIIYDAQLLTLQAQNSLLKLIEEPNDFTQIILITNNYKSLIPTILSRCEIIEDRKSQNENISNQSEFIKLSFIDKLAYIDKILLIKDTTKQKISITNLLRELLETNRNNMLHGKNTDVAMGNIQLIQDTNVKLRKNSSKRLSLENLIINLK